MNSGKLDLTNSPLCCPTLVCLDVGSDKLCCLLWFTPMSSSPMPIDFVESFCHRHRLWIDLMLSPSTPTSSNVDSYELHLWSGTWTMNFNKLLRWFWRTSSDELHPTWLHSDGTRSKFSIQKLSVVLIWVDVKVGPKSLIYLYGFVLKFKWSYFLIPHCYFLFCHQQAIKI